MEKMLQGGRKLSSALRQSLRGIPSECCDHMPVPLQTDAPFSFYFLGRALTRFYFSTSTEQGGEERG